MPGDVQAGGFFWRMGVKSTVREDLAGSKQAINEFEGTTTKTSGSLDIMDQATGKNARGIKSMGTVAMMAGGSMMMLSMSMKDSEGNITALGNALQISGMALTGFGTVSMVLPPIIRAIGFANAAIIPAIMGHAGAQIALAGSEVVATGATITLAGALDTMATATIVGVALTAIVVTAAALYTYFNQDANAAKELEKQIKSLDSEIKRLNETSKAQSYQSKQLEDALSGEKTEADKLKDSITSLTKELDDYNRATKDAKTLTNDLAAAENDLKSYTWDRKDALEAIAKATTPEEAARARIALTRINIQHKADVDHVQSLKDQKKAADDLIIAGDKEGGKTGMQETLTGLLEKQSGLIDKMAAQQETLNGLKLKELATNEQLATLDFKKYFLDMQKVGTPLTAEEMATFTADPNSPAAKALKSMPGIIKQEAKYGTINPDGTYTQGNEAGTVINPIYKGTGLPNFAASAPGVGTAWKTLNLKVEGTFPKGTVFSIDTSDLTQNGVHYT